jgi:hypothetical protein
VRRPLEGRVVQEVGEGHRAHGRWVEAQHLQAGRIAVQVPALAVDDEEPYRSPSYVVPELRLAGQERLLGAPSLRDVGEDDAHQRRRTIVGLALAGQVGVEDRLVVALERQVAFLLGPTPQQAREKEMPAVGVGALDEACEGETMEVRSIHPEKRCGGQVRSRDEASSVGGEVTDRGEIVQLDVARVGLFQGNLGASQLLVLHLQLDLVNLKFVQQPRRRLVRCSRRLCAMRDHLLGMRSQSATLVGDQLLNHRFFLSTGRQLHTERGSLADLARRSQRPAVVGHDGVADGKS